MLDFLTNALDQSRSFAVWLLAIFIGALISSFLGDNRSYRQFRVWLLRRGTRRRYAAAMMAIQHLADRWLGMRVLVSGQSFGVCFLLAIFYPLVSILVGWSLGGPITIAGLPILEDEGSIFMSRWLRVIVFVFMLGAIGILIGFVRYRTKFVRDFIVHNKSGSLTNRAKLKLVLSTSVVGAAVVAVVVAGAVVGAIPIADAGTFMVSRTIGLAVGPLAAILIILMLIFLQLLF